MMTKPDQGSILSVSSIAALLFLTSAALAQSTPMTLGSSLNPTTARVKNNSLAFSNGSDANSAKDPLAGDARLDVKVTFRKPEVSLAEALRTLGKKAHIELVTTGSEVSNSSLCLFADDTALRDVLNGIAHVQDLEWVRHSDKTLELRPRLRLSQWDGVRPNTEAQAEQYRQGRQFFSQLSSCTPTMQATLTDMHQGGVAFGSLPPEMQKAVESMLVTVTPSLTARGRMHVPSLEDSTIRLQQSSHQDWGSSYLVDVYDGHTWIGIDFPVFSDPNMNTDQVVPVADVMNLAPWSGASQDAASRQEITRDPARLKRLQVPVAFDLHDVSLAACLEALASKTGLGFAADAGKTWVPQQGWVTPHKSAVADGKPLVAVLDQLAALYGQTWGQAKGGLIVFHPASEKPASERIVTGNTGRP